MKINKCYRIISIIIFGVIVTSFSISAANGFSGFTIPERERIEEAVDEILNDLDNHDLNSQINPYIAEQIRDRVESIDFNKESLEISGIPKDEDIDAANVKMDNIDQINITDFGLMDSDFSYGCEGTYDECLKQSLTSTIFHEILHTIVKNYPNTNYYFTYADCKAYACQKVYNDFKGWKIKLNEVAQPFIANCDCKNEIEEADTCNGKICEKDKERLEKGSDAMQPDESFAVDAASYPPAPGFVSDVSAAVLISSFSEGSVKLLEGVGHGTAVFDLGTSHLELLEASPVLILPSGALSGLDNSEVFKEVLKQYVSAGGTIICFAQQYGYEFSALPGGEVAGYGWVEDQACHGDAVYVDMEHPVLAGQEIKDIDAAVDGYFTNIPEGSKVLLRRTKNQYPTMIEYPYGNGRVIATTMYEDWAYGHAQSTAQARKLMRDMLSWVKATSPMLDNPVAFNEYLRGDTVTVDISLEAASFLEQNAAKATLFYTDANRNVIGEEVVELATALEPGQQSLYNYSLNLADDAPLGVCYIDYDLLNEADEVIQPRAEGTAFAVKLEELGGGVRLPDFQIWVTSYDETAPANTYIDYEVHIRNNTKEGKKTLLYSNHSYTGNDIFVHPHSVEKFDYRMLMPSRRSSRLIEIFDADIHKKLASTFRYQNPVRYAVQTEVNLEKTSFTAGELIKAEVTITNEIKNKSRYQDISKELVLKYIVTDSNQNTIFNGSQTVTVNATVTEVKKNTMDFEVPSDVAIGKSLLRVEVYDGDKKVGYRALSFNIAGKQFFVDSNYPEKILLESENTVAFQITNKENIILGDLNVQIDVMDSAWDSIYNSSKKVTINELDVVDVVFNDVVFGNTAFDDYFIVTHFTGENMDLKFLKELKNDVAVNFDFNLSKYLPLDEMNLDITLRNTGDFVVQGMNFNIKNSALIFEENGKYDLEPGQVKQLVYTIPVPVNILAGVHDFNLTIDSDLVYETKSQFVVPDSKLEIKRLSSSSKNRQDFELNNLGGGATDYLLEFVVKDVYGNQVLVENIENNIYANKTQEISINIPTQVLSGSYQIDLTVHDKTTEKVFYKSFEQNLSGIDLDLAVNTDKEIYTLEDNINIDLSAINKGVAIENAKLNLEIIPQTPFGTLYGTVVDSNSNPIAGAEVAIAAQTCYTNNSGVYKFDFVPVGESQFSIKKNGFHLSTKVLGINKGLNEELDVLTSTIYSTLNGSVANESGDAIIDALVKLKPNNVLDSYPVERTVYVDADGKYSFADVPYGEYLLNLSSTTYETISENIVIEETVQVVDNTMNEKISYSSFFGQLLKKIINKPIRGAQLTIGSIQTTTDENGYFVLENISSSVLGEHSYELAVFKIDEIDTSIYLPIESGEHQLGEIYLASEQTFDVNGTVTDSSDLVPVANAIVILTPSNASSQVLSTVADSAGVYLFEDVAVGEYNIEINREFYNEHQSAININSANTEFNFALSAATTLMKVSGTVVDSQTLLPIEMVNVNLDGNIQITDSQGSFEYSAVPTSSSKEVSLVFEIEEYDNYTLHKGLTGEDNDLGQILLYKSSVEVESGNNIDFETADHLSLNKDINGYIDVLGAQDYYKTELIYPGAITVGITNGTGGVYTQVIAYDENFEHIATSFANSKGDGVYKTLKLDNLNSGTYYFRVGDKYDHKTNVDPYKIKLLYTPRHDVYESNNSFDQATSLKLHENITGAIFPKGDEDYYSLNIAEQGQLTVKLQDVPAGFVVQIIVYDDQGNEIAIKTDNNSVGRDEFILRTDIVNPGKYYCLIKDRTNTGTSEGSYKLSLRYQTIADSNIYNGDIGSATPIGLDEGYNAAIFPLHDEDYYKFTIDSAQYVNINIKNVPSKVTAKIDLYDSVGNLIISKKDNLSGRDYYALPAQYLSPGEYFVCFSGYGGSLDTYTITVNDLAQTDAYENNNTIDLAKTIYSGLQGKAKIYPTGDMDYYKFSVRNSASVKFSLTNIPSNISKHLQILDNQGNVLKEKKYYYGGGNYSIDTILPGAGDYYVMFQSAGVNAVMHSSKDDYHFELIVKENPDIYEANDDFENAIQLNGQSIYPTVYPFSDQDFYKIAVTSAGTLNTYVDVRGAIDNLRVAIYDDEHNVIAVKKYAYASARSYNFELPKAGIYYIEFSAINLTSNTTSYYSLNPYTIRASFTSTKNHSKDEVELYAEQIESISIEELQNYNLTKQIDGIGLLGNYQLQADFINVNNQIVKSDYKEFSIQDGALNLRAIQDKDIYPVNETIQISGSIILGGDAVSGPRTIQLLSDSTTIDSNVVDAIAGQTVGYQLQTTMVEGLNSLKVLVLPDNIESNIVFEESKPKLELSYIAPTKVGRVAFETSVELANIGNVDLDEEVCLEGICQSITVPVEQIRTVKFENTVAESTDFSYQISGTVDAQLEQHVDFVEAVAVEFDLDSVYAEGNLSIPFVIKNTGEIDSEFELKLKLNETQINRSFFVPMGEELNDLLTVELSEGEYAIELTSPFESKVLNFTVAKFNKASLSAEFSEIINNNLPINVNIDNLGYNDIKAKLVVESSFAVSHQEILIASNTSINKSIEFNSSAATAGEHDVAVKLVGEDGLIIAQTEYVLEIFPADFQIKEIEIPDTMSAGQEVELKFTVENVGGLSDNLDFNLNLFDLYKDDRTLWIEPGESTELVFNFLLDDNLEDKSYHGEYSLNGEIEYFDLKVEGIKIAVQADLDKKVYEASETANFEIKINSENNATLEKEFFLKVHYGDFEYEEDFILEEEKFINVQIPVVEGVSKVFYAIYASDGRSIYLNTKYIYTADDILSIYTDKDIYNEGETVLITGDVDGAGTLKLTAIAFEEEISVGGAFNSSFVLPTSLQSGTYDIIYNLNADDGTKVSGVHRIDVHGFTIKILEKKLDSSSYAPNDSLKARVVVESNRTYNTMLKTWISTPSGEFNQIDVMPVILDEGQDNVFELDARINSYEAGIHKFIFALYNEDDELIASTFSTFDLGGAILLDADNPISDYPAGNEEVELKLSVMGNKEAKITVYQEQQIIHTEDIIVSAYQDVSVAVFPDNNGLIELTVEMDCDGVISQKDISFKYGHVSAPSGLEVSVEQNIATLNWDRSVDSDISGYVLKIGKESGVYDQEIELADLDTYQLDSLEANTVYYMALSAKDINSNESYLSNEISVLVEEVINSDILIDDALDSFTIKWHQKKKKNHKWSKNKRQKYNNFTATALIDLPEDVKFEDIKSQLDFALVIGDESKTKLVKLRKRWNMLRYFGLPWQHDDFMLDSVLVTKALAGKWDAQHKNKVRIAVSGRVIYSDISINSQPITADIRIAMALDDERNLIVDQKIKCKRRGIFWTYFKNLLQW